jgi:hypothetical protein
MPLSELRKPENVARIKQRYGESEERKKTGRKDKSLVEMLTGLEDDRERSAACLICQL